MNASLKRVILTALVAVCAAFVFFIATKLGAQPAVAFGLGGFVLIVLKISE